MADKKWYVFDVDCLGYRKTAAEAAVLADQLIEQGFEVFEIKYLTEAEFSAYCISDEALKQIRSK
jgi:2-keto-3-deoxy-6-phosphogluconate aldolase